MFVNLSFLILGFIFLIKGADIMVDGSSSIAKRFGVSSFFIGLTVVAFGTSAPELVVSVLAVIKGSAGIALGNIIGSNISNTLLVLGVSAVVAPLVVKKTTIKKEIPFALLAVFAVFVLANDFLIDGFGANNLSRIDGIILMLFFGIFIVYTFGISREKETFIQKTVEEIEDIKEIPKNLNIFVSLFFIILGILALAIGGSWIVKGSIGIARVFGVSEALVGLTIVALGTSLPELATSVMAASKGKTDMAVGNVVGSNIFNLLWVLGLSSYIKAIPYAVFLNVDFFILFSITVLLFFLIYFGKKNILGKWEGSFLVFLYVIYIIFLVIRG